MNNDSKFFATVMCFLGVMLVIATYVIVNQKADIRDENVVNTGLEMRLQDLRADAIKRGYAQYNPTNGEWNWK